MVIFPITEGTFVCFVFPKIYLHYSTIYQAIILGNMNKIQFPLFYFSHEKPTVFQMVISLNVIFLFIFPSLASVKIFSNFYQFDYDVSVSGCALFFFLVNSVWDFLSLLILKIYIFFKICRVFSHCFFIFLCHILSRTLTSWLRLLELSPRYLRLCSFFFQFFSLLFRMDNFYWYIFTWSFHCYFHFAID